MFSVLFVCLLYNDDYDTLLSVIRATFPTVLWQRLTTTIVYFMRKQEKINKVSIQYIIMFIFRCGGKSDLISEDCERSNPRWLPFPYMSNVQTGLILEPI